MKRYITVLALSALVCSSCSDFLDVQPEGNATTTSYFLNDQQAIDAIDGLYERFHQEGCYGREVILGTGEPHATLFGDVLRGYNSLATLAYTGDESHKRCIQPYVFYYVPCELAHQELVKKEKGTTLTAVENAAWATYFQSRLGTLSDRLSVRYG